MTPPCLIIRGHFDVRACLRNWCANEQSRAICSRFNLPFVCSINILGLPLITNKSLWTHALILISVINFSMLFFHLIVLFLISKIKMFNAQHGLTLNCLEFHFRWAFVRLQILTQGCYFHLCFLSLLCLCLILTPMTNSLLCSWLYFTPFCFSVSPFVSLSPPRLRGPICSFHLKSAFNVSNCGDNDLSTLKLLRPAHF